MLSYVQDAVQFIVDTVAAILLQYAHTKITSYVASYLHGTETAQLRLTGSQVGRGTVLRTEPFFSSMK